MTSKNKEENREGVGKNEDGVYRWTRGKGGRKRERVREKKGGRRGKGGRKRETEREAGREGKWGKWSYNQKWKALASNVCKRRPCRRREINRRNIE